MCFVCFRVSMPSTSLVFLCFRVSDPCGVCVFPCFCVSGYPTETLTGAYLEPARGRRDEHGVSKVWQWLLLSALVDAPVRPGSVWRWLSYSLDLYCQTERQDGQNVHGVGRRSTAPFLRLRGDRLRLVEVSASARATPCDLSTRRPPESCAAPAREHRVRYALSIYDSLWGRVLWGTVILATSDRNVT